MNSQLKKNPYRRLGCGNRLLRWALMVSVCLCALGALGALGITAPAQAQTDEYELSWWSFDSGGETTPDAADGYGLTVILGAGPTPATEPVAGPYQLVPDDTFLEQALTVLRALFMPIIAHLEGG